MAVRRLLIVVGLLVLLLLLVSLLDPTEPGPTDGDDPREATRSREDPPESPTAAPTLEGETADPIPTDLAGGPPVVIPTPVAEEPPKVESVTIRGVIRTADGKPPKNGTVHLLVGTTGGFLTRKRGHVKADGTFEIPGISTADLLDPLKIDVGAEGFLEETYKVALSALEEGRVEIVLGAPVTISGRLVDEAGKPVAGTRILYYHGPYVSVRSSTGADGRFSFPSPANMGLGAYLTHRVQPEGILRWPPTDRDLDLGDVTVPSGRPVTLPISR